MFPTHKTEKDTKRIRHYDMGNGVYARVELTPQESKTDRYEIQMIACEVDADGNDKPDGLATRTMTFVVSTLDLGDTTTLESGWVRLHDAPSRFSEHVRVKSLPPEKKRDKTAVYFVTEDGVEGTLHQYDVGVLEKMRQLAVSDLAAQIEVRNRPVPSQVLDL